MNSNQKAIIIAVSVVVSLLLIAGVVVLVVLLTAKQDPEEPERDYGVIIDAGSSSSKIFVYSWPHVKGDARDAVPQVSPVIPLPNATRAIPLNLKISQIRVRADKIPNSFVQMNFNAFHVLSLFFILDVKQID